MFHDMSPEAQSCPDGQKLMAQTRINGAGSFQWSQCSQSSYENFINQKTCLNDLPASQRVEISKRIGYEYDANEQCKLYSPDTQYACVESQLNALGRTLRDICGVLHCVNEDGVCKPTPLPSADGTRCGHDGEECQQGKCTTVESANGIPGDAQVPMNGGWSDWISPDCSRTCGGGVQIQYDYVITQSDAKRYQLCSIQPCVSSQMDYRNDQCAKLFGPDSTALTTSGTGDILCQMNCFNANLDITQGNGVYEDGTRCGGDFDVCVDGYCEAFGCDGVHNSPVSMDKCGICDGNGQSCKNEGIYNVGFPG
ncbi:putative A disintegrin and metalloproteinase with thrombospondin motifs 13, partial [Apostichopus japonicus]